MPQEIINKYHAQAPSQQQMPIIKLWLAMAIAVIVVTTPITASNVFAQEGETIHIVRAGESLSSIASRYGISVSILARHNQISNINFLRVGQSLRIPATTIVTAPTPTQTPAPAPTEAQNNYTPTAAPVATPHVVQPGYPTATPTPVVPTPTARAVPVLHVHVVAAGETLTSIANYYGTSVPAIKARNGLTSDRIYRGQRLIIP